MNTNSEVTLEILKRFNEAFQAHRPEDLDDLIGEGCVLENTGPAPDGARYEGREACLNFWKGIASSANLVFQEEEIWASADRGIIRWQLRWGESVKRLAMLTPNRRPKLTPLCARYLAR